MTLSEAERILEASPDHRVLRRVLAPSHWRLSEATGQLRRGLFVDCETTGLDTERDEVIELALVPFGYDARAGRIVSVEAGYCSFRQPSFPIPAESSEVHGISDADVAGAVVDEGLVCALVDSVHLVIAHNARFDRPMLEKHWPVFERKPWACSLNDLNWREEGMSAGKLDYLLLRQGWFHEGHRALDDALAGAFLLTLDLPKSGRPALLALLENARKPLWVVRAEGAAFEQKAALKARGYRWDDGAGGARPKAWWLLTGEPEAEWAWLNCEIYHQPRSPVMTPAPANNRYSSRVMG